jgi:uncharacterized protein YsxB (DUF464 family)
MGFFVPSSAWGVDSHFFAVPYCAAEVIEKGSEKGIDSDQGRCGVFEAEDCGCLCRLCNGGHGEEGSRKANAVCAVVGVGVGVENANARGIECENGDGGGLEWVNGIDGEVNGIVVVEVSENLVLRMKEKDAVEVSVMSVDMTALNRSYNQYIIIKSD